MQNCPTAAQVRVWESRYSPHYDEAINFAKEKNKESLSLYFQAIKCVSERDHLAAEAIFRVLVAKEPDNTEYQAHLAANIMLRGQAELMQERTLPWRMPAELRDSFKEAEGLLSAAIESLRPKEARAKLVSVFVNRSGVRLMLGKGSGVDRGCAGGNQALA